MPASHHGDHADLGKLAERKGFEPRIRWLRSSFELTERREVRTLRGFCRPLWPPITAVCGCSAQTATLNLAGITGLGLLDGITLGLGGVALVAVAVVAAVARRAFHERIETLKQSLEQAPTALEERNDLPPEVLALARKLGVPKGECSRLVRLTRAGRCG